MTTYPSLNSEKALIWRILHLQNLPWVLTHGLHCASSETRCSAWVSIGNPELIAKRAAHAVPASPGGVLSDYVPFYFTPFSVMMRNINTGWGGIKQWPNEEIVILVSSIRRVKELGLRFLFTDSHAYYRWTSFYSELEDLQRVDWDLLQRRDFRRDPEDPARFERYQAEALVHQHVPREALLGIMCYSDGVKAMIEQTMANLRVSLPVYTRPGWYFDR